MAPAREVTLTPGEPREGKAYRGEGEEGGGGSGMDHPYCKGLFSIKGTIKEGKRRRENPIPLKET